VRTSKKTPADLDFTLCGIVAEVSRRADDFLRLAVNRYEGAAAFQRLSKKLPENALLIAIAGGMLLPDQRVGSDGE